MRLLLAGGFRGERGGTRSGYKGGKGESVIWPTTNEQPRAVMRSPMRDPMRDIDLMVLGDVGTSTPPPKYHPGTPDSARKSHPGASFHTVAAHGSTSKL